VAQVVGEGAGAGVERRIAGLLLVDQQGGVGAAVASGEERRGEEAEVRGGGGVTALGAVDVDESKVVLGASADVAEVRAEQRGLGGTTRRIGAAAAARRQAVANPSGEERIG
jgi:hypothetical protein